MKILVTGSAGHLGEALVRTLAPENEVIGLDVIDSPFTQVVGTITDREIVESCMGGVDCVLHTATLHKPHMLTHTRQQFIETNLTGTLNLLEAAAQARVKGFVYTSTTSTFGRALTPLASEPAAWIEEHVTPVPKNIYGVTKTAAEDLCELFHINQGFACIVLRTSRFFPEEDDNREVQSRFDPDNLKVNEYLYRRVDIEDAVNAHILAMERVAVLGFGKYIISASTPFKKEDLRELRTAAPHVVERLFPDYTEEYARRGWKMFPGIDRVYVNARARNDLDWNPRYDFGYVLRKLQANEDYRSPLAVAVGAKGYHSQAFTDGPYSVT
jgi:nucleoside-diphosphate-sugar epimerase